MSIIFGEINVDISSVLTGNREQQKKAFRPTGENMQPTQTPQFAMNFTR